MTIQAVTQEQYKGQSEKDRLAEGERILSDKVNGMRVSELMEKYDLSKATIHRRIDRALKDRIALTVDAYREVENAGLDDLVAKWRGQADAAARMVTLGLQNEDIVLVDRGMTRHAEALNGMLRVMERRARLNGLDAPVKVDATVTVQDETDRALQDLEARLGAVHAPAPA